MSLSSQRAETHTSPTISTRRHGRIVVGATFAIIVASVLLSAVSIVPGAQAASGGRNAAARAAMVQVHIKDFTFTPHMARVKAGTTVVWTNLDTVDHTVTSGNNSDAHKWRTSQLLSQGQHFAVTFRTPGTYPYYCKPHYFNANMHGVVIVTR